MLNYKKIFNNLWKKKIINNFDKLCNNIDPLKILTVNYDLIVKLYNNFKAKCKIFLFEK